MFIFSLQIWPIWGNSFFGIKGIKFTLPMASFSGETKTPRVESSWESKSCPQSNSREGVLWSKTVQLEACWTWLETNLALCLLQGKLRLNQNGAEMSLCFVVCRQSHWLWIVWVQKTEKVAIRRPQMYLYTYLIYLHLSNSDWNKKDRIWYQKDQQKNGC